MQIGLGVMAASFDWTRVSSSAGLLVLAALELLAVLDVAAPVHTVDRVAVAAGIAGTVDDARRSICGHDCSRPAATALAAIVDAVASWPTPLAPGAGDAAESATALARAIERRLGIPEPADADDRFVALSEREADVARLAVRGLTNREIAGELFVTVKTVEFHMGRLLAKLGITSRRQLRDD